MVDLFPVSQLYFLYILLQPSCSTLPNPPSTDKARRVYLLQFFFFVVSEKILFTLRRRPGYSRARPVRLWVWRCSDLRYRTPADRTLSKQVSPAIRRCAASCWSYTSIQGHYTTCTCVSTFELFELAAVRLFLRFCS